MARLPETQYFLIIRPKNGRNSRTLSASGRQICLMLHTSLHRWKLAWGPLCSEALNRQLWLQRFGVRFNMGDVSKGDKILANL